MTPTSTPSVIVTTSNNDAIDESKVLVVLIFFINVQDLKSAFNFIVDFFHELQKHY